MGVSVYVRSSCCNIVFGPMEYANQKTLNSGERFSNMLLGRPGSDNIRQVSVWATAGRGNMGSVTFGPNTNGIVNRPVTRTQRPAARPGGLHIG